MRHLGFALGLAALTSTSALAQSVASEERTFPVERLRPAMDREGIIGLEVGSQPLPGEYDAALWLWYAHNPLVLYRDKPDGTSERLQSLVGPRLAGSLTGQYAFFDWMELGVSLPFVALQSAGEPGPLNAVPGLLGGGLQSTGLGDLRLSPKFALLNRDEHLLDVAVIPTLTLPTALLLNGAFGNSPEYMGESFLTFAPAVAISRGFSHSRVAFNLGARFRPTTESLGLVVGSELFYGVGGAYRLHETVGFPLELAATLGGQLVGVGNINAAPLEFITQGGYDIDENLRVSVGAGVGLIAGYATPDFRVLANVSWSARAARGPVDRDGDGVLDDADRCPTEPEDIDGFEDADGCPDPDNDGDGVADAADRCPAAQEDADGHEDEDGCPDPDNDEDGVPDTEDECPNLEGDIERRGCPVGDLDGDGVLDEVDACPEQPEDKDSFEDADGCPDPDNDNDGVLDVEDRCAAEPEDVDGFEDEDGCPDPDNDSDGIADADDKCPIEAEVINGIDDEDGCPDEGKTLVIIKRGRIEILDKVYFQTSRATIQERSFDLLGQVASILKANPRVTKIRVEGHTDSAGSAAGNKRLSSKRAGAVRTFLIKAGIDESRLLAEGFGEERPVADNATADGREENRRVEFRIIEMDGESVDETETIRNEEEPDEGFDFDSLE